jgi:hypothetical protein
MSRRGQRSRYNEEENGWERPRRVNGDNATSSLSSSSMSRELDDLMRTIESDWNVIMLNNVTPLLLSCAFVLQLVP